MKRNIENIKQQKIVTNRFTYTCCSIIIIILFVRCLLWPNILLSNTLCIHSKSLYLFLSFIHFLFLSLDFTQLLRRWKSYFSIAQILLYRRLCESTFHFSEYHKTLENVTMQKWLSVRIKSIKTNPHGSSGC